MPPNIVGALLATEMRKRGDMQQGLNSMTGVLQQQRLKKLTNQFIQAGDYSPQGIKQLASSPSDVAILSEVAQRLTPKLTPEQELQNKLRLKLGESQIESMFRKPDLSAIDVDTAQGKQKFLLDKLNNSASPVTFNQNTSTAGPVIPGGVDGRTPSPVYSGMTDAQKLANKKESVAGYTTWTLKDGGTVNLPKGTKPPEGAVPYNVSTTNNDELSVMAKEIGDAIMDGEQPPEINSSLRRVAPHLRAYLGKNDYDLVTADKDWRATKKRLLSLNGPQQIRLMQATNFAYDSLDIVDELAEEWDAGQFAPLNSVNLFAAEQGAYGEKAASVATRLVAQINDLVSELGTVYKGGNSSTDESLKLAATNLKAKWSRKVLFDNTKQVRRNLRIRKNSMKSTPIMGLDKPSQYTNHSGGSKFEILEVK